MPYTVTQEAVDKLATMSTRLDETTEKIKNATDTLKSAFEANKNGLGPHSESIGTLIEDVEKITEEGSRPVKVLALKLMKASLIRAQILEKNRYSGGRHR